MVEGQEAEVYRAQLQPFAQQKMTLQNLFVAQTAATKGIDGSAIGALFDRRTPFWTATRRRGRDLVLEFERHVLVVRGGYSVHINEPAGDTDVLRLYLGHTANLAKPSMKTAQRIAFRATGQMQALLIGGDAYQAVYRVYGADVLSQALPVSQLYEQSQAARDNVESWFLNQHHVAGIGPKTVAEAAVIAGCALDQPVQSLTPEQFATCALGAQLVAITALVFQVRQGETYPYRDPRG